MLKTRRVVLDANGNYIGVYGQGDGNWCYNAEALTTILREKCLSVRGEIINHADFGIEWFDGLPKEILDSQLRNMLLSDRRVYSISSFISQLDLHKQQYSANIVIDSDFGELAISI